MSSGRSDKRRRAGNGAGRRSRPQGRSVHTVSLLFLVGVVFWVALQMVVSLASFVVSPDPGVRAGPMYVTLTLMTGAALLMLAMALNASFLPFLPRKRAPDVYLVMSAMGITGAVTGLLTVGGHATPYVTRLVLASLALAFITIQNVRLAKAREAAAAMPAAAPAAQMQPAPPRSRQRRGGRKK